MATLSSEDIEALKDIKDMGKEIDDTKQRILKLEDLYTSKYEKLEERILIHSALDCKIERTLKENSQVITINAGGKLFTISKNILLNTRYKNILQRQIETAEELPHELFVECSKKCFDLILQIVRFGNELPEEIITSSIILYMKQLMIKEVYLEYYMKSFFLHDCSRVFNDWCINRSSFVTPLEDNIANFNLSRQNPDPELIHKNIKHFSELFKIKNHKAIYLDSNSDLVIELIHEVRIKKINLRVLTKSDQYKGVKLLNSFDGEEWIYISKLGDSLNPEKHFYSFNFSHRNMKIIKIKTEKQISIIGIEFE